MEAKDTTLVGVPVEVAKVLYEMRKYQVKHTWPIAYKAGEEAGYVKGWDAAMATENGKEHSNV